jgi:peptide/nickel transport system permease protein
VDPATGTEGLVSALGPLARAARRVGSAIVVVWLVVSATFLVNNILPSDPARMIAGPQARPGDVARIRTQLGLDRPLAVQYARFVGRLVHVGDRGDDATCAKLGPIHIDLGRSFQQRRPVVDILADRLPPTLLLALAAVALQALFGLAFGVVAAIKKRTVWDFAAVSLTLLGVSTPTFILGVFLQFLLAHRLALVPLDGYGRTNAEHAACLVLPALTLGIYGAAYYTRLVRDEMIGALAMDHVRTARAKGLSPARVVLVHALRNAAIPLITAIGLDLGALVGGAIVTETLFRWPGIGALSTTALLDRDGPVIVGIVLLTSTAVVVASTAVDLVCTLLDPASTAR